jgi:hypothetical protein
MLNPTFEDDERYVDDARDAIDGKVDAMAYS